MSGAYELDVTLTVNGTPVSLRLPARVTLADALRDHLGLTGTHLGCEHGVCGMCTVLVDGEAARACLLFGVQLDGAEVVTVEGLGRPDDQHPLQRAFSEHHALQCGFCTPGFLLSAYDLLADGTDVEVDGRALSGVLCRCTGYRNIVSAVRAVAAAYPDGVPPPGNCGAPSRHAEPDSPKPAALTLPTGPPTTTVTVDSVVAAPLDDVWRVLTDIGLLARCLPGAELTEHLGGDRYRGVARVALGPIRLSFTGLAQIAERDATAHRLHVRAQGSDAGGAQTHADVRLTAEAAPAGGTRLRADADVFLTGRIAQFGRALAGDVSRRLFEQFAEAVGVAATSGTAPATRVNPAVLLGRAAFARLRALFRRR
jgi:xanthine dehydrogenase YagT iron-sulfur-binding subunit